MNNNSCNNRKLALLAEVPVILVLSLILIPVSCSSCRATTATAVQYINFKNTTENGTDVNTSLPSHNAQILYSKGKELFGENKYEQAIAYFDRALA
ncbi:MAG TPA: hypothetical protein VE971_04090, partial [Candidatus Eisenbacteria bacterium]|nr:hypothetical protein [Candidatus Eisenbacteria bacterium]